MLMVSMTAIALLGSDEAVKPGGDKPQLETVKVVSALDGGSQRCSPPTGPRSAGV